MTGRASRPDIGALTRAELERDMFTYLRAAQGAYVAYGKRDDAIHARELRRCRDADEARLNARIVANTDPALGEAVRQLTVYQTMHALYAMHLLVTDRPVPPGRGEAGPRPVVPAAPGARPGTGPDLEPGMTVSYELNDLLTGTRTVVGTVTAVRADGVAHVSFRTNGGSPMEVIAPVAAFSPVRTASAGGGERRVQAS